MTTESKGQDRADMLVSGIANIEKARKEIEKVVKFLINHHLYLHLSKKAHQSTKGEPVKFRPDSSSRWTFRSDFGNGGRTNWYIYLDQTCVVDEGELHPFGAPHVMEVRKNLGDLVDDLIMEAPDLNKYLTPFFEAADA